MWLSVQLRRTGKTFFIFISLLIRIPFLCLSLSFTLFYSHPLLSLLLSLSLSHSHSLPETHTQNSLFATIKTVTCFHLYNSVGAPINSKALVTACFALAEALIGAEGAEEMDTMDVEVVSGVGAKEKSTDRLSSFPSSPLIFHSFSPFPLRSGQGICFCELLFFLSFLFFSSFRRSPPLLSLPPACSIPSRRRS